MILGRDEMKLSQLHGQLSNNWLPLLLTCWPNSPPWFSARSRMELFISTVRTIGLVYRLPPTIFQLTLRSTIGYIGNKLFLRELRRLTIDRWLASYYRQRVIEAIILFCMLLFQDIVLYCSPFPSLLLLSFLRLRRLVLFLMAIT